MRPQAGPGKFQARAWPEEDTLAPATPQKADTGRRRARRPAQLASAADSTGEAARPPSWRGQVQELERTVNAELRIALSSAMLVLADQVSGWHMKPGRTADHMECMRLFGELDATCGVCCPLVVASLWIAEYAAGWQAMDLAHIHLAFCTGHFVLDQRQASIGGHTQLHPFFD